MLNDVIGELVEGLRRYCAAIEQFRRVALAALLRKEVHPVVIGPHQRELQAVAVRGAQIPLIKPAIEEHAFLVPIPIEDELRQAMIGRGIDLAGEHGGVAFVLAAPRRHLGLLVAGEARPRMLQQFPFRPAFAV